MKCGDYINISPRVKLLDVGIDLDNKELISLEQIVKTASKGRAHFTSNVMAIVGEGVREAEVKVPGGGTIRTRIPRHIDKIVKTHNTISQEGLNGALFAWVYTSPTWNNPPLYVTNGKGSIVFTTPSGATYSFTPVVASLYNGSNAYTFIFVVNDESTNSYTTTQQQLFPWVVYPYYTNNALQLSIPLSTANLVLSKSSNQILTYLWAVQVNLSSAISLSVAIGLFQPNINGLYTGLASGGYPTNSSLTATSGSTTYFSGTASYYFLNVNGILYAVAVATDTSSNSYTPQSISASYWGMFLPSSGSTVGALTVTTPPNAPGTKASYASVSWYNALYLTT